MSEAEARAMVEKCHHTSFAKVDPADRHGACSTCVAAALQARDARFAELEEKLSDWRTGKMADHTGHMFRCAKVNGVWCCASGCAAKERDALAERLRRVEGALRELLDGSPNNCECAACVNARVVLAAPQEGS